MDLTYYWKHISPKSQLCGYLHCLQTSSVEWKFSGAHPQFTLQTAPVVLQLVDALHGCPNSTTVKKHK